jgi:DNA repair exonuclease SbcCD ATPase subunit
MKCCPLPVQASQSGERTAAQRLRTLDQQLNELKGEQAELSKKWEKEKEEMQRLQSIKNEIDRVNLEIQAAERDYDLNRAAELKYGTLLQLQKQLKEAEEALERETVTCWFSGTKQLETECARMETPAPRCCLHDGAALHRDSYMLPFLQQSAKENQRPDELLSFEQFRARLGEVQTYMIFCATLSRRGMALGC